MFKAYIQALQGQKIKIKKLDALHAPIVNRKALKGGDK